jgi:anaerobic C4-dicarboxylate transporter DcuA
VALIGALRLLVVGRFDPSGLRLFWIAWAGILHALISSHLIAFFAAVLSVFAEVPARLLRLSRVIPQANRMSLTLELIVLLAAIAIGARAGGVGMGLWGGVGLAILVFAFGEQPGSIPGEVLLIILTVIMAASAMEAAGGIDYLVKIASSLIRKSPQHVTIVAPLVAYLFTFLAGTGHVFYPLLPVIYEVAMKGRVRPERPIAVATIASQQAITASPVSAATAALIAILGPEGMDLPKILLICVPST